jgi:ABC-2 type transport system ATP-binding protein
MIEVVDIVKTYPGGTRALDGISFKVEKGEICGYLGANGAGKTTTIRILTGMLSADSGSVIVNGYDVFKAAQKVKKMIGYVPESGAVFQSLTPYEFLEFVCRIYDVDRDIYERRINEFMDLFGLKNEIRTPMASFSKGMCQKVLIISSLIHNPEIIFWDEPLGGVDINTSLMVRDLVKDLSSHGKTFFYSSHVLDVIEKTCTKVIILNSGKVAFEEKLGARPDGASLENIFKQYVDTESVKDRVSDVSKNLLSNK